jgi:hypothetical protein
VALVLYKRIPSPTCTPPSPLSVSFSSAGRHLRVYTFVEKLSQQNIIIMPCSDTVDEAHTLAVPP